MAQSLAIPRVIPNDWKRLDLIVNKIKFHLGSASSPTFAAVTVTGLTASTLVGANADKALESVTVGTGLDYTRPNLTLSHLGIEALTDPGADRIFFWDNGVSKSEWLSVGPSLAITTTNLDTIQDIRTSASPTFAGLHINSAEVTSTTLLTLESDISNNNEYNEILFKIAGGQNYGAIRSCVGVTAGDSYMSFFTTTDSGTLVRQVTIQHNGKVGLGTYNPETFLTMVNTAPYLTLYNITEEDTDGGGESRIIGKREDGAGTGTAAGQIEISHDGSGANDQLGKYVVSVNTGAGLVQALEIGSDLLATFAGAVNITTIAAEGADVDKFLVDSSGVVKYRTGTQVLSDIGASASGHNHDATYQPLDAELTSLAALSYVAASFVKMTGANTFVLRTIGETADDLQGTIDHDLTANYVADKHVAHAGVSITAGKGLSGGGTIASTRDIALDLTEMTGNVVWDDGSTDASITWTYALSGANDPVWTIGANSMDLTTGVLKVGGTTVMLVGGAPTAHVHDGDTLQLDAINSSAGAFAFDTGGLVTFNEAITMSAGKDLTIAGHIIFNTNNSYIGFTNPKITFNDTSDRIEITGGLTGTSTAAFEGASVTVGKASTTTGTIILHDSGSANTITLTVPNALAGSLSFTLPPTDGADTNVLQTNGSGVLSWVAAGGAGTVTLSAYTDEDSDSNTMLVTHAYKAVTAGMVSAYTGTLSTGEIIAVYVGLTDDPAGAGDMIETQEGYGTDIRHSVSALVAADEYFEIITTAGTAVIRWKSFGTLSKPIDQEAP